MILYRPVGSAELQLIAESGYRAFPPRLPDQPIFYPVLNLEYAREIASRWNVPHAPDHRGFVTRFEVEDAYAGGFEVHTVGAGRHQELWVPAEELAEFNLHILGTIAVVDTFPTGDQAYVTLRERPELEQPAAEWFHSKWGVPAEAYLECMDAYLKGETELGWYLCLEGSRQGSGRPTQGAGEHIVGGLGVIENDFHDRKDLSPNVCAVYTELEHRGRGIAGRLLDLAVEDLRSKGISPVYLVTDHTGFYERYGWEFFCLVQGDGEDHLTRMYIHR